MKREPTDADVSTSNTPTRAKVTTSAKKAKSKSHSASPTFKTASTPAPHAPISKAGSSAGGGPRTLLSNADKHRILLVGMDILAKVLPFRQLAEELGIPESRLKDQFKANRANFRRTIEELYADE